MALTPDDIVNHEFRQTMRGYAVAEVDELLDRLADQVERNERDLAELRQRLEADGAKLADAQRNEAVLTQTLVTAQQTAQRTVQDAEERAAIIVADAQAQSDELTAQAERQAAAVTAEANAGAERMRAETEQERAALRGRFEHLIATERTHREELRAHLERLLAALDERGDDPAADALLLLAESADGDRRPDDGGASEDVGSVVDEHGWGDLLDAARDAGPAHDGHDERHGHDENGHDEPAAEEHHVHGG